MRLIDRILPFYTLNHSIKKTNLQVINLLKYDLDFMLNGNLALCGPEKTKENK